MTPDFIKPCADSSLQTWLDYIEALHAKPIDLGLERMHAMIARLGIHFSCPVFTVAGTNGKGSTCAMLESILRCSGLHVGMHTSPHLLRFNERAIIDGREVTDEALIAAFERVEAARGEMTLSYFEYTGLAILLIFAEAGLDAVILEIGLGGRLDAMNTIDTSCGIVCAVGIDHVAFLGDTRELIGAEKAGIYRPNVPAICTDRDPPATLVEYACRIGAPLSLYGRDFTTAVHGDTFDFRYEDANGPVLWEELPLPALAGANQIQNAAGVLAGLAALRVRFSAVTRDRVCEGLRQVRITARFERVKEADASGAAVILDVGHNPQAAEALARNLAETRREGVQTWAVFGMLADKDMQRVIEATAPEIDRWYATGLTGPRAADWPTLQAALVRAGVPDDKIRPQPGVPEALSQALADSCRHGVHAVRLVVFGSFVTVSRAIAAMGPDRSAAIFP